MNSELFDGETSEDVAEVALGLRRFGLVGSVVGHEFGSQRQRTRDQVRK